MMSFWRLFRCLLRHVTLILALTFLVFHVLDWYNPLMAFSTNPMSSTLLLIFSISAVLLALTETIEAYRNRIKHNM